MQTKTPCQQYLCTLRSSLHEEAREHVTGWKNWPGLRTWAERSGWNGKKIRKNLQGHAPKDLVTDCQSQARWGGGETRRQLAWMTAWVGDGQGGCHQQK